MATASTLHNQPTQPSGSQDRFNTEATSWDTNPFIHTATAAAHTAITTALPPTPTQHILEIGCGTGVLSLLTAHHAALVVAIDAAPGMISVLQSKLSTPGAPTNIIPLCVLLTDPEDPALPPADLGKPDGPRLKFDLVTSHLVLHHIADVRGVLGTMYGCLSRGGKVALTDFEDFGPGARRFHPESRMVGVERDGIGREWIRGLLEEVGFVDVRVEVGFTLEKAVERFEGEWGEGSKPAEGQGEMMDFPFLLCMGTKP